MDDALRRVVDDYSAFPIPPLTRREIRFPEVGETAVALVGMRRVGKSYFMYQRMQELLEQGVPRSSMLFLNLEDDRLGVDVGLPHLDRMLEYFFETGPRRHEERAYLFFDEIQAVPGWEKFILRVINTENVRIVLTGSSAKMLTTEIATEMRGRSTAVEVLPFSFSEYLRHHGVDTPVGVAGSAVRSELAGQFRRYLAVGGFPGVQEMPDIDRSNALQEYVELVLFRDVVERHDVQNLVALRHLTARLVSGFAREFTLAKVHGFLESQNVKVAEATLREYHEHLQDARLLYSTWVRRQSEAARMRNPRISYVVDPGLARAVAHPSVEDTGYLLQNAVYLELRRRYGRVHHAAISHFTSGDGGVDFVVDDRESGPLVLQVAASMSDERTREREIRGARAAMREVGTGRATVITLSEAGSLDVDEGSIEIVPAWRWMLLREGALSEL